MIYTVLDYTAALIVIVSLLLVSRYKKAWLLYSANTVLYVTVTISKGLVGLTIMGICLGIVGIYNYLSQRKPILVSMHGAEKYVDISHVVPEDIDFKKMAKTLSQICRYGGRSGRFYSVAEHCYHASYWASSYGIDARYALLHDAAETFIGDVVSTYKRGTSIYGTPVKQLEDKILETILDIFAPDTAVCNMDEQRMRQLDLDIRVREAKQLHIKLGPGHPPEEEIIRELPTIGMSPKHAEKVFLQRAAELGIIDAS